MASVNRVNVGGDGAGAAAGVMQMGGALAGRQWGGPMVSGIPQAQIAMDKKQMTEAQNRQKQQAMMEKKLIDARKNSEMELARMQGQVVAAMQAGNLALLKESITQKKNVEQRIAMVDRNLAGLMWTEEVMNRHFSITPNEQGQYSGTLGDIQQAFASYQGRRQQMYDRTAESVRKSLALALARSTAESKPQTQPGLTLGGDEVAGGGADRRIKSMSGMRDALGIPPAEGMEPQSFEPQLRAGSDVQWLEALSRDAAATFVRGRGASGNEQLILEQTKTLMRGLYGMASSGQSDRSKYAEMTGSAVAALKGAGVTDLELQALTDTLEEAGQDMVMGGQQAAATGLAADEMNSKEGSPRRSVAGAGGVDPQNLKIGKTLGAMGTSAALIGTYIDSAKMKPEYAIAQVYEPKGTEVNWGIDAGIEFVSNIVANGLDSDPAAMEALLSEFPEAVREDIVNRVQTRMTQATGDLTKKGLSTENTGSQDLLNQKREATAQKESLISQKSDIDLSSLEASQAIQQGGQQQLMDAARLTEQNLQGAEQQALDSLFSYGG